MAGQVPRQDEDPWPGVYSLDKASPGDPGAHLSCPCPAPPTPQSLAVQEPYRLWGDSFSASVHLTMLPPPPPPRGEGRCPHDS